VCASSRSATGSLPARGIIIIWGKRRGGGCTGVAGGGGGGGGINTLSLFYFL